MKYWTYKSITLQHAKTNENVSLVGIELLGPFKDKMQKKKIQYWCIGDMGMFAKQVGEIRGQNSKYLLN